MKKLLAVIALITSVATLVRAANVTDTGPGQAGDVLYFTGQAGNDQGTWSNLPSLVQTIVNNNVTVPATIGTSLNSGAVSTVGTVDVTGTGIAQTVTGSGATGTSSYDFSNLQTNQSVQNTTDISNLNSSLNTTNTNVTNLSNTVNSNSTDISSLQSTVNTHTTQINGIQNLTDNSLLTQTVNSNTAGISDINNMSDPTTVLNQTVNGNTVAIANETTRATGAEGVLQNNINTVDANHTAVESGIQNMTDGSVLSNTVNTHTQQISALNTGLTNETNRAEGAEGVLQTGLNNETNARIAGDQALQSQINNINAQAQDNTNRIDRLEQTKYLLEPTVRLYDDKHFQVQAFDSYDVRHTMNFAAGLRVMYKLGPSYEEKLIKKTNPEIARLLSANISNDVVERDSIRKQLAEDRRLISEQAALLKQLSARNDAVVLAAPLSKRAGSNKILPGEGDEDLLKAMDARNDAFASK